MATRKWIPIVIALVLLIVVAGIALVASMAYMVSQRVHVEEVSAGSGEEQFEQVRARFAGQKPYIVLSEDDGAAQVNRDLERKDRAHLSSIHVRVFVPKEGHLVSIDLPFWMMRMMGSKPVHFRSSDEVFGGITLSVNAADIERRGPGLVLDHGAKGRERVIIWTE